VYGAVTEKDLKPMRVEAVTRTAILVAMTVMWCAGAQADSAVTFHKDVEPILQQHCVECHRASGTNTMGMVAPMAFTSYEGTRPWAKSMAKQVEARTMPPWHASGEFDGVFKNERKLSDAEIATLVAWTNTGAPKGNPADAPAPKEFASVDGWSIGEPDLIVEFDKPYLVRDHVEDEYASIYVQLTDAQLPEDRWIKAMDFRPGSEAVHHIVMYSGSYRESLGFGQGMLGGMGPGTNATVFPEGYGRGFLIPAYAENHKVVASETFRSDTIFLALFPHTHLRGKASQYVAYYPDGKQETLLHVPNYDFNWQTNYIFKEPKMIPAGTRVEVTMWYDNSKARAEYTNIDPSRNVGFGEPTTDEMMFGWIDYCNARPMATTGSGD
jgi:hypothetical protein